MAETLGKDLRGEEPFRFFFASHINRVLLTTETRRHGEPPFGSLGHWVVRSLGIDYRRVFPFTPSPVLLFSSSVFSPCLRASVVKSHASGAFNPLQ
jgi:hypothetical protein